MKTPTKLPENETRNYVAVALQKRHGLGVRYMKDRRTPRGGAKNKQAAYRAED